MNLSLSLYLSLSINGGYSTSNHNNLQMTFREVRLKKLLNTRTSLNSVKLKVQWVKIVPLEDVSSFIEMETGVMMVSLASFFLFGSKALDISFIISSKGLLYCWTESTEWWPVRFIISCSSMPAWYNAVVQVRFSEWFVMMSKESSTKIFNFMTPGVGDPVIRSVHIGHIHLV